MVSGGVSATLSYDPLGRLFLYTANGQTTDFLYDGDALIAEYQGGSLVRRYVHGDEVDEPWVQYTGAAIGASQRIYLHTDRQHSIIAHSDSLGNSVNTLRYDAYGIADSGNVGRFGYTGQIWLAEIGLYYYKARMYSPVLGRFLQTDPIGYEDQMNLYAYVGNDPVNLSDPSGMCIEDACIIEGTIVVAAVRAVITVGTAWYAAKKVSDAVNESSDSNNSEDDAESERQRNRDQGIPDSKLGPSGKPKVHSVQHSTLKSAEQAAKKEADRAGGKVRNDAHPKDGQKPHFQAEDAKGKNVKPVVHHCKPGKSC